MWCLTYRYCFKQHLRAQVLHQNPMHPPKLCKNGDVICRPPLSVDLLNPYLSMNLKKFFTFFANWRRPHSSDNSIWILIAICWKLGNFLFKWNFYIKGLQRYSSKRENVLSWIIWITELKILTFRNCLIQFQSLHVEWGFILTWQKDILSWVFKTLLG